MVVSTDSCVLSAIVFRNYLSIFLSRTPTNTYPTARSTKSFCYFSHYQPLPLLFYCPVNDLYGPDPTDNLFPCRKCHSPVTFDLRSIQCETCDKWYHASCQRVGDLLYNYLSNSSCSWHCTKGNSANYSTQDMSSFTTQIPLAPLTQVQIALLIRHRHLLPRRKSLLKTLGKLTVHFFYLINFLRSISDHYIRSCGYVTCSRPQRTATGGLEPGTSRPKVLGFTTASVRSIQELSC